MGLTPDVWSYNIMIKGYCKNKRVDEAVTLFKDASQKFGS